MPPIEKLVIKIDKLTRKRIDNALSRSIIDQHHEHMHPQTDVMTVDRLSSEMTDEIIKLLVDRGYATIDDTDRRSITAQANNLDRIKGKFGSI